MNTAMGWRKGLVCAGAVAGLLFTGTQAMAGESCSSSSSGYAAKAAGSRNVLRLGTDLDMDFFGATKHDTAAAGPLFSDIEVNVMYGYASVEDKAMNASGHDQEVGAFLISRLGERWTLGLNVAQARYRLGARALNLEQTTESIDLLLGYDLTESWSVGTFINVSQIDIEQGSPFPPFVPNYDDDYTRYGFGFLAAFEHNLTETVTFGYSTALASLNKQSFQRVVDDDDTIFINRVNVDWEAMDSFFFKAEAAITTLLDRENDNTNLEENDLDGTYYILGVGAEYLITEDLSAEVGYETTACDEDRNEDWVKASINYRF